MGTPRASKVSLTLRVRIYCDGFGVCILESPPSHTTSNVNLSVAQNYAGFSLWFHLPRYTKVRFGHMFLSHSQFGIDHTLVGGLPGKKTIYAPTKHGSNLTSDWHGPSESKLDSGFNLY